MGKFYFYWNIITKPFYIELYISLWRDRDGFLWLTLATPSNSTTLKNRVCCN